MNSSDDNKNDVLIVTDVSYLSYFILFGSVTYFQAHHEREASQWIKPLDECDQENLPNLLNCETYKGILKQFVMSRLEKIESIARQNFQNEIDCADKIDFVFAMDDNLRNNFRVGMYPQYKGQRRLVKRQYQVGPIKNYITDVIFKELDIENKYGYHLVKVEGAEGDDVIATTLINFKDRYGTVILFSSDHDFLQIDGVHQLDMKGNEVVRELGDVPVTAKEFLLGKILMGDKSDNIPQVFKKCGPKKALKLVRDIATLKKMLEESQDSANQFVTNKNIISFSQIPKDLSDAILEKLSVALYDRRALNSETNLRDFMML